MLRHYADDGFPAGPFKHPVPVFTTATGRGKIHLTACKGDLVSAKVYLWNLSRNHYCKACFNENAMPHGDYVALLQTLSSYRRLARTVTNRGHCDTDDWSHDEAPFTKGRIGDWYALTCAIFTATRLSDRPNADPDLRTFIRTEILPQLREARDELEGLLGMFRSPSWRARLTAARVLGEGGFTIRGCSVIVPETSVFGRNRGHHKVYSTARNHIALTWQRQEVPDRDELVAAGLRGTAEGLQQTGLPERVDQLPQDVDAPPVTPGETLEEYLTRTWRTVALAEVGAWVRTQVDDLLATYDADLTEPNLVVKVSPWDRQIQRARGQRSALLASIEAAYPILETDAAMVLMPRAVLEAVRQSPGPTSSATGLRNDAVEVVEFGPTEPDDTPEVFNVTRLLHVDGMEPAVALTMARASMLAPA